jgi:hypothetical protein
MMPHFKCLACKTRLYSAAGRADLVGDLCPGCGSLLEPVGEPAEVAGFRSIRSRDGPADGGASGTHQRIADRFGDFIARRETILAQARLDARRWVDEDGRFHGERVPLPQPRTSSATPGPPTIHPTGDTAMKIVERLRDRSPHGEAGDPGSAEASSADDQPLPIARYDQLDGKEVTGRLSPLSQVELAAVEAYEQSHRDRPVVLNRLRWLRTSEPLPRYDSLDSDEIVGALADADAQTLKAVRSYERHHRDRREVSDEVARALPKSRASAGEDRAREEKTALVQAGIRARPGGR